MQSLRHQAFALKEDGEIDAVRSSTSPSRLQYDSNRSYTSDSEDKNERIIDKAPDVQTSDKWSGSNTRGRKKGKKAQGPQKTNHSAYRHFLKLPPIKPLQVSEPRIRSADLNSIRELKSHVWDLQQQLSEARTENKLLKRLQHRHTVALQRFQDSEDSVSKILTSHRKEARVLQESLHETRACRDNLASQLQTTENKLLTIKASFQHLQLLSQDHSLLEREELTSRLTRALAELQDKDKRILELERNLKLCQTSFNRQIVTEQKKINEARKISSDLQEHIHQLNKDIQGRDRNLETHNIYSHRFLKGPSKKVSENKLVQTDALVASPSVLEHMETEEKLEETSVNLCRYDPGQVSLVIEHPEKEVSANASLVEIQQEKTEICVDTSEQCGCSEESPEYQIEEKCAEEKESPQVLEEGQKPEEDKSESLNLTQPERKGPKLPENRLDNT